MFIAITIHVIITVLYIIMSPRRRYNFFNAKIHRYNYYIKILSTNCRGPPTDIFDTVTRRRGAARTYLNNKYYIARDTL